MQITHEISGFVTVWQFFVLTTAPVLQEFTKQEVKWWKLHLPFQLDCSAWPANYTVLSSLL